MTQVDATYFPFNFNIGDRVRSKLDDAAEGVIKEGFFSGELNGPYVVTYRVETENETVFIAKQMDLERVEE